MGYENALQKIHHYSENGMKLKAAMRLRGLINDYPQDIQLRSDLAKLYYDAGFLDAAGLFWILDEPVESHIKECVALYEASVNNSPLKILKDIKFRGDKECLPFYAKDKLRGLEERKREIDSRTRECAIKNNVIVPIKPESFMGKVMKNIAYLFVCLLGLLVVASFIYGLKEVKRLITEW